VGLDRCLTSIAAEANTTKHKESIIAIQSVRCHDEALLGMISGQSSNCITVLGKKDY